MQEINSHMIGVDQGEVELFSEFASGGDMWTGSGSRERRKRIAFSKAYKATPAVHVSLSLWDMDSNANVRADLGAENVTEDGFDLVFRTWSDTRIARVRLSWMAIGALPTEDDWQLY